jgi:glycosyltransferase involved in cell wall biosynthesis
VKIAFVCDRVNPIYYGGYEYTIYNVSQRLSVNHKVTVFTSMDKESFYINNVEYVKVAKKYNYVNSNGTHNLKDWIRFVINLKKNLHKLEDYDVVIVNTIPYLLLGRMLKKLNIKKISIFHEAWYDYLKEFNPIIGHLLYREIKSIVKQSNLLVAMSSKTKDSLLRNYKAKKVVTIPTGIEIKFFSDDFKYKYDVIYLGRLAVIKHIDDLINSIKIVKHEFPNVKVAIGGYGDQMENLIKLSKKLELQNNIEFLGRFDDNEKFNLLRMARIFVLPSEREGFSLSTLEAMFCGAVPIVAQPSYAEVFGCSDFVINNVTGLYFNHGNVDELGKKILYLLKTEEFFNKLSFNAKLMSEKYNWDSIIEKYESILKKI